MNKKKYLISNITMIMMLFLLGLFQYNKLSTISFLNHKSMSIEFGFIVMSIILLIVVALITYYVPMLIIFEYSLTLNILLSPVNYVSKKEFILQYTTKPVSRIYLRLNVIRCWFLVVFTLQKTN